MTYDVFDVMQQRYCVSSVGLLGTVLQVVVVGVVGLVGNGPFMDHNIVCAEPFFVLNGVVTRQFSAENSFYMAKCFPGLKTFFFIRDNRC